ncbi:MAG: hypothetical protein RL369_932, partial [Pseudomonadota bacterium]
TRFAAHGLDDLGEALGEVVQHGDGGVVRINVVSAKAHNFFSEFALDSTPAPSAFA